MTGQNSLGPQFDYGPRTKNKPNAQGTLFRAPSSMRTPESRQPRGYSPERYRAVQEALGVRRTSQGPGTYGGHEHGGMGMHVYHGHADVLARSVASVARSTVPLEHITRPVPDQPASEENPDLHLGVWAKDDKRPERGHYSKPGSTAIKHQGRIAVNEDATDQTVIHEIGHHVDRANPYRDPAEQGAAEGFADAYASRHARTAGYKQRPAPREPHPEDWHAHLEAQGRGDHYEKQAFDYAYRKQHPALQPGQFDDPSGLGPKTYPKGHIEGQLPLLHKTADYDPHNWSRSINHRVLMPDWARQPESEPEREA
jgi:hypothetical protein